MDLKRDGCALVTGGSRGIGAATARALAADDWAVGVNFRTDDQAADSVVEEIRADDGRAEAVRADVSDRGAADAMFAELEERLGPVLVLVNNAGVRADALTPQLGEEEWSDVLATNLSGAFWTTRRALGPMLRRRFGRIVNVSSAVATRANAGQANYAAAKAGLLGFTRTVAVEVARRGVTVNAVAPGLIATDMTRDVDGLLEHVPARRPGSCDEVAACIRFLASPAASYVTGTTVAVDGGFSA